MESLGFVDLSRRCHLFCHQHLAFGSVQSFFFPFFFRYSLGVLARMVFPVLLPGNLYYISRGMQQHEALFMVTASWIRTDLVFGKNLGGSG